MASRIMHYAMANQIGEKLKIKPMDRFMAGTILPDACQPFEKDRTHLAKNMPCHQRTYDLTKFLFLYHEQMNDPLYQGYYCHLIQDIIFRKFLDDQEQKYKNASLPKNELYQEYDVLNTVLIHRYNLKEINFNIPEIAETKIVQDMKLDIDGFQREFHSDFIAEHDPSRYIYLLDVCQAYMELAIYVCVNELNGMDTMKLKPNCFNERKNAWIAHKPKNRQ